jgi:hypothetical protein
MHYYLHTREEIYDCARAVVNMLVAMFLAMGFYAGFIVDHDDMAVIAKQLDQLMTHGLLDQHQNGRALTIAAAVAAADFLHTWPGTTG